MLSTHWVLISAKWMPPMILAFETAGHMSVYKQMIENRKTYPLLKNMCHAYWKKSSTEWVNIPTGWKKNSQFVTDQQWVSLHTFFWWRIVNSGLLMDIRYSGEYNILSKSNNWISTKNHHQVFEATDNLRSKNCRKIVSGLSRQTTQITYILRAQKGDRSVSML